MTLNIFSIYKICDIWNNYMYMKLVIPLRFDISKFDSN